MRSATKFIKLLSLTLLVMGAILTDAIPIGVSVQMELTADTDKSTYYLREKVAVQGTAKFDGLPVSDALVALEVRNPRDQAMVYRTVTIGNPTETWVLNITDIALWDMSYNPLNTAKVGETVMLSATVANPMLTSREYILVTLSVYDGNMVPLQALVVYEGGIEQESSVTAYGTFHIPNWAYSGMATVYASVYDGKPADAGVPYLPEKPAQFYISRTQQGLFSYSSIATTYTTSQTPAGTYGSDFRLSPTPEPGDYSVYATVRYSPIYRTSNSATFNVLSTPSPPTASFTFLPTDPYPNMTVTFDASSSSAEGYNDVIIRYEWDFGDGTPKVVRTGTPTNPPNSTETHKFLEIRQYIVTLNVTDNEGLWSATLKPITTKPTNPTAAFTWSPEIARIDTTVTFDASTSLPGWSIPNGSPAPIASYVWNFGDGPDFPVTTPIIGHIYIVSGNFTVTLEVIDTENQRNSVSHIISVSSLTYPVWDVNQDGKVDIKDLTKAAKAYGSNPTMPNWDPAADVNADGKVNIADLTIIALHYGEQY